VIISPLTHSAGRHSTVRSYNSLKMWRRASCY